MTDPIMGPLWLDVGVTMRIETPASELLRRYPDPPKVWVEAAPRGWNVYGEQGGVTLRIDNCWTRRGADRMRRRVERDYARWSQRVLGGD